MDGYLKLSPAGRPQKKQRGRNFGGFFPVALRLFIFALSCGFGFLLALHARLLVMLSLAEFRENTGTGGCTLEATKCAVQGLAFLHSDFCHFYPPLRGAEKQVSRVAVGALKTYLAIIHDFSRSVKRFPQIFEKTGTIRPRFRLVKRHKKLFSEKRALLFPRFGV